MTQSRQELRSDTLAITKYKENEDKDRDED